MGPTLECPTLQLPDSIYPTLHLPEARQYILHIFIVCNIDIQHFIIILSFYFYYFIILLLLLFINIQ
jgi:hypothetical protein